MNFGLGEFFSLASAAAWAVGVILYRRLGERLPPLTLNFLKNSLVLAMLLPLVGIAHGLALPAIPAADVAIALASGFIGIAVADTLYLRALNAAGAARMGIVGNLYSPFVILLSFAFLDERLLAAQWAGFALVMAGVGLIAWPARPARQRDPHVAELAVLTANAAADAAGGHDLPAGQALPKTDAPAWHGIALGALAIALMAVAIVMVKRTLETQPLFWITAIRTAGALAGLALMAALRGEARALRAPAGGVDWPRLAIAAFVGQLLAMLFWLAGYKYADASVASVLNETASVFILLLAWVWLKESIPRRAVIGVGLTMGGVVCMLLPSA